MATQQPRSIIHRNRERLACTECRRRKLKCDREVPCGSCKRRNDERSCTFQAFQGGVEAERQRRLQAESRLEHLEELVRGLAQSQSQQHRDPELDQQTAYSNPDSQLTSRPEPNEAFPQPPYEGETHWSAMLDDIDDLRIMNTGSYTLLQDQLPNDDLVNDKGVSIVFGGAQTYTLQDILTQYLPMRKETDRMLSTYFRAQAVAAPFVHSPTFRKQYQDFWSEPTSKSILWTSMLFSICHIASSTLRPVDSSNLYDDRFAVAAARCLTLGTYFRPSQYATESILLFVQAQALSSQSLSPDIGMLMSQAVRIATVMGYHRDPSPSVWTPFHAEMRRRVWSFVLQLDLLISFHLGLPSNVQYPTWDTKPPRNLLDSDFDEFSQVLQVQRPDDFPSEIQFYNTKLKLMTVFEKVQRHILSPQRSASELIQVDQLDAELRAVWESLPPIYAPRAVSDSVVDSAHMIVTRLCVSCLYYKCLCVLHRPYVIRGRRESVLACFEAASGLVGNLLDAADEFKPGGQADTERWFMSSLTWHDFLLGSMALCLILCAATGRNNEGTIVPEINTSAVLESLGRAKNLCYEYASSGSRETFRVIRLLERALQGFDGPPFTDPASVGSFATRTSPSASSFAEPWASTQMAVHVPSSNHVDTGKSPATGQPNDESWNFLQHYFMMNNDSETLQDIIHLGGQEVSI